MAAGTRVPGQHDWVVQEEYDQKLPNGTVETWLRWRCQHCTKEVKTPKTSYMRPPPTGCVSKKKVPTCPNHGAMQLDPPPEQDGEFLVTRYKCTEPGCTETARERVALK